MGYGCHFFDTNSADFNKLEKECESKFLQKEYRFTSSFEPRWQYCFKQATCDPGYNGLMLAFNISGDYETDYIDSPDFEERVNFWIGVGKSLGLLFDDLQWKVHKSQNKCDWQNALDNSFTGDPQIGRALMFYLPTGKMTSTKELHLHLFFLRYLYEKHATIDRYIELREQLEKTHPYISNLGTLILAEVDCHHTQNPKGTSYYQSRSHYFLEKKELTSVLKTAKGLGHSNLREWCLEMLAVSGEYSTFDRNLIVGGSGDDLITRLYITYGLTQALAVLDQQYKKEIQHV